MSRTWNPKRRRFLSAALAAPAISCSRRSSWRCLTDEEARTAAAICDCLIPADEFPGAAQAGAVVYIDRQLSGHLRKHREAYREGLAQVDQASLAKYGEAFARLGPERQAGLLKTVEKQQPEFFALILAHTMQSYYGDPRHGGNRDGIGYRMLGLAVTPVRGREGGQL